MKFNKKLGSLILLTLMLNSVTALASTISGNVKIFPIVSELQAYDKSLSALESTFKFQLQDNFFGKYKLDSAIEFSTNYQKHIFPKEKKIPYRIIDLNHYLIESNSPNEYMFELTENLNRFNISFSQGPIDLIIGRQPIFFGSARSINPTDVLMPFSFNVIDKEDRNGVDAIVARLPISDLSTIEAGYVGGEKLDQSQIAYYLRPKFNWNKFDVALTAMQFRKKTLYGLDVQHSLWDAGYWFEGAYTKIQSSTLDHFYRLTTGIDYKFQNTLYLSGEYHYNGAGKSQSIIASEDYLNLKSKNYFITNSSYEITPLLIGSLSHYLNLIDHSQYLNPKIEYNYSDNLYFGLGALLGIGPSMNSEFGNLGRTYYSSIKYYF